LVYTSYNHRIDQAINKLATWTDEKLTCVSVQLAENIFIEIKTKILGFPFPFPLSCMNNQLKYKQNC